MFVIPILAVPLQKIMAVNIVQIWMFLERNGTHAIQVDNLESALAFAKENEFPLVAEPYITNEIVFLFVDPKCKELASFYSWSEIHSNDIPMKEVWRPFLWVKDSKDMWGTNQYLNDIKVTSNTSVYDIIDAYCYNKQQA